MSEETVFAELKKLKRSKATGLDNLPPGMLKDAASILRKPLTYVINLSLTFGIFPSDWKSAKIIPIHKSGSRKDVNNFRPISILSASVSKIFGKSGLLSAYWLSRGA